MPKHSRQNQQHKRETNEEQKLAITILGKPITTQQAAEFAKIPASPASIAEIKALQSRNAFLKQADNYQYTAVPVLCGTAAVVYGIHQLVEEDPTLSHKGFLIAEMAILTVLEHFSTKLINHISASSHSQRDTNNHSIENELAALEIITRERNLLNSNKNFLIGWKKELEQLGYFLIAICLIYNDITIPPFLRPAVPHFGITPLINMWNRKSDQKRQYNFDQLFNKTRDLLNSALKNLTTTNSPELKWEEIRGETLTASHCVLDFSELPPLGNRSSQQNLRIFKNAIQRFAGKDSIYYDDNEAKLAVTADLAESMGRKKRKQFVSYVTESATRHDAAPLMRTQVHKLNNAMHGRRSDYPARFFGPLPPTQADPQPLPVWRATLTIANYCSDFVTSQQIKQVFPNSVVISNTQPLTIDFHAAADPIRFRFLIDGIHRLRAPAPTPLPSLGSEGSTQAPSAHPGKVPVGKAPAAEIKDNVSVKDNNDEEDEQVTRIIWIGTTSYIRPEDDNSEHGFYTEWNDDKLSAILAKNKFPESNRTRYLEALKTEATKRNPDSLTHSEKTSRKFPFWKNRCTHKFRLNGGEGITNYRMAVRRDCDDMLTAEEQKALGPRATINRPIMCYPH